RNFEFRDPHPHGNASVRGRVLHHAGELMARRFIFRNNVSSRLLMAITPNQTTLTVLPGDGEKFPEPDYEPAGGGEWFAVTLWDRASGVREICYCTGRAGD